MCCCQLRPTEDRRQLITLSVHLCVQHDGRDLARRAGPSTTAETCYSGDAEYTFCTTKGCLEQHFKIHTTTYLHTSLDTTIMVPDTCPVFLFNLH